jgi:diguanylate cyclase (GGDEF)-like protein
MAVPALIAALCAAALVAVAALAALRRSRAALDRELAAATRRLAEGLGYASEYAASLDGEEILGRALEAIAAVPGVDAAVIVLTGADGRRSASGLGLSDEETERIATQMPPGDDLRSLEISYRYRLDEASGASRLPRSGLIVPLRANGRTIGSLCGVSRAAEPRLAPESVEALETLARRVGPALANAQLFAQVRLLAEFDALTTLHNRRSFDTLLGREVSRARRYDRRLSLILLDLDEFKRINDRIGHLGGDEVLAEVAARIRGLVRSTDVAARVGGDEFAVVLPESGREEAELLAGRILKAVSGDAVAAAGRLAISAGVAELQPGDGARELFERADAALYRAKDAGKSRRRRA